jgi:predicted TIM-barrel fold metal-dependent hydrolase
MSPVPFPVVDADAHVIEGPDLFVRYLDPAFRDRAPRFITDGGGARRMMWEGRLFPPFPEGQRSSWRGTESPAERLGLMDEEGIEKAFLFPSSATFFPFGQDRALAMALVRAYNDYLGAFCAARPERLHGIALACLHDVPWAIAEAGRAVRELHLRAVMVRPNPLDGRRLDDVRYLDFYAAVEELGVPLIVHETTGCPATAGADRYGIDRPDRYAFNHIISHPFEQMLAVLALIGGGVLERFPRLRVGFFEAGAGWLPYWLWRLDEHFELPAFRSQFAGLTRPPSEYFRRQCFTTCEADETNLASTIAALGEERVMFASDFPHFDSSPGVVEAFWKETALPDTLKRRVLRDNCLAFYGL